MGSSRFYAELSRKLKEELEAVVGDAGFEGDSAMRDSGLLEGAVYEYRSELF